MPVDANPYFPRTSFFELSEEANKLLNGTVRERAGAARRTFRYRFTLPSPRSAHSIFCSIHKPEWLERQKSPKQYGGVGAVLTKNEQSGEIIIENCVDESPAQKAGLRKDDVVIAIDDVSTQGKEIADVVGLVRGEVNTPVTFTIRRNGGPQEKIKIQRVLIPVAATPSP